MTLEKRVEAAREALGELIELQKSALSLEKRANGITAPEDKHIRELCERYGYGAVMDSAARQWHLRDGNGGGHTTYHCYSVVQKETIKAQKALAAFPAKPMTEDEIKHIFIKTHERWNKTHEEYEDEYGYFIRALRDAGVLYCEDK